MITNACLVVLYNSHIGQCVSLEIVGHCRKITRGVDVEHYSESGPDFRTVLARVNQGPDVVSLQPPPNHSYLAFALASAVYRLFGLTECSLRAPSRPEVGVQAIRTPLNPAVLSKDGRCHQPRSQ